MKRRVVRVKQSPLNVQRWNLDLECGHEVWVTSKSRPARKQATCPECVSAVRSTEEES